VYQLGVKDPTLFNLFYVLHYISVFIRSNMCWPTSTLRSDPLPSSAAPL
jgi:hypothetical protein